MTRAPRPALAPATALLATLMAALAAPAGAQESLTPEAFLRLAEGKTLAFTDAGDGALVGIERFLPHRRTVWIRADGGCAHGTVTVEGPEVCFVYDDDAPGEGPHCWWPLREGAGVFVRIADAAFDEVQKVSEIADEPLSCEAEPAV